jgi:hypothetical protein
MKSRIEQDHDQYLPYALIHPRGAAYAPLPQAPTGSVRIPLHATDCDVLIRMGLLKDDQRQDPKALQKALLGLLYRAEQDLP